MTIAFIDLQAQRSRISSEIVAAIARVLGHGRFVMGPEVAEFEEALANFGQAGQAIACANGTDALAHPLRVWGIGPGDAVFCPSFTFAATAEVVPWFGATPVFVDVMPGIYTMNAHSLASAIEQVVKNGELIPRVVIAVDLFGQPADYPAISDICRRYNLKLIADSAQGFGCTLNGHHPLHWADVTTTSFFPAKPLGCYGDGGAMLTNDDALAADLRSVANHGAGSDRYDHARIGMNSRLDTMQAAVLIEKLKIFADEIERRNAVATRYREGLSNNRIVAPDVINGGVSTWAQYTIEHDDRDSLQAHLQAKGVPSAIYYARPMHRQTAYGGYPTAPHGLPVTEAAAGRVLSLPMHPYLDEETQYSIIEAVHTY